MRLGPAGGPPPLVLLSPVTPCRFYCWLPLHLQAGPGGPRPSPCSIRSSGRPSGPGGHPDPHCPGPS